MGKFNNKAWDNRPIVLLRPGHEVWGIPAAWSWKKHCFLYVSEALSWPTMALNDCFFVQLAWKLQSMFGDVLVQHWHCKKSRFERLSPTPKSPVSCHRSGPAASWPELWMKNASLDNAIMEWRASVFKCESLGSDLRGSVPVDGPGAICIATVRQTTKLIHTKQAHYLQNRQRNRTFVHLIIFFSSRFNENLKKSKKRKNGCFWAVTESKNGWVIAARRCTWSISVLVLIYSSRKILRSCQAF